MIDTGYMNFFSVDRCGLYKVGSNETHGCELAETFELIHEWVKDRPLSSTLPWDAKKARRNIPKFYCKDIHKDPSTGDYILVMWKSDTDSAGSLWGAQEDTEIGTGKVVKYTNNYKGKKLIWGRPSYYWIIPEFNAIISIKFEHSVSDSQLFQDYVIACINNRVKHKNRKKEFTEKDFVRISYIGEDINYQYGFIKKLMSINTSTAQLNKLASRITHIIRRETISVDSKDERAEWLKMFNNYVPYVGVKPKSKKRKIEVRAEAKPSVAEIKEIIEKNAKEGRKSGDWDNVGFVTDTGITWVDRYRLKDHITIINQTEKLLGAKDLFSELMKKRDKFLKPIMDDMKKELAVA